MPNHEREAARAINGSWPVMERYFETPAWRASGTDPAAIMRGMPWADWTQQAGRVVAPLAAATAAAFGAEATNIGQVSGIMGFSVIDDVSIKYAQTQGSKLIASITESQRATVRTMVGESLRGDWTVDQLGRRLRDTVGLHPAWATAVTRYEEKQVGVLIREGKTPEVAAEIAAKRAAKKHKHLLKVRGENIARTEIQTASNLGKYATWDSAIGKGFASKDSTKEFSPGPGACEICAPITGEVVGWDQPFSNGKMMPPFHPGCRCTANLLPPDYNDADLDPEAFDWLSREEATDRPAFIPDLQNRIGSLANRPAPFVAPAAAPAPAPLYTEPVPEEELVSGYSAADEVASKGVLLDTDTRAAVDDYAQSGFLQLNEQLRAGKTAEEILAAFPGATGQKMVHTLEGTKRAIQQQAPLDKPITVYRGSPQITGSRTPGSIISDEGFVSTTLDKDQTAQFFIGKNPVFVEIRVPAGHRVGSMNTMRQVRGRPNSTGIMGGEAEVLLPPGTKFRVISNETNVRMPIGPGFRTADRLVVEVVEEIDPPRIAPRPIATPFEAPAPVAASRANDLTLQSTAHLTDDDLGDLLVQLSADDPEAVDKILEIFDQREEAAARAKAFDMAEEAREAEAKVMGWGEVPEEYLKPLATAPSRSASRALTPDEQVKEDFYAYIQTQHAKALNDLNGNFFKQQYRGRSELGLDEFATLFEGNTTKARKYASEELIAWWEENGRHTLGSFRYGALGRAEDYKRHQRVLREGFGGKLGGNRDRSTF